MHIRKSFLGTMVLLSCSLSSVGLSSFKPGIHPIHSVQQADVIHTLDALQQQYGKRLLVVFDDDDTLETTDQSGCGKKEDERHCQYLGGTPWYNWQSTLIETHPNSLEAVANNLPGLFRISALLFDISQLVPTEAGLGNYLQHYQSQGVSMMVSTAREPGMSNATLRELSRQGWSFEEGSPKPLFSQNIQLGFDFIPNKATCQVDAGNRPVRYQSGVYFVAGQNKGATLDCLFQVIQQQDPHYQKPKALVFFDDAPANDQAFYDYFHQKYPKLPVFAFIDEHMKESVLNFSKKAKARTTRRWQKIKNTLVETLAQPALPK